MIAANTVTLLATIFMLFSPIYYINGEYTSYSVGIGPTVCYALGFLLLIGADIVLIIKRKKINSVIVMFMLPLSFMTIGLLVIQIVIPEFLYTAQAITLSNIGMFFVIENPVGKFQSKAYIDDNTQMWNRNGYEFDIKGKINDKFVNSSSFIYVMADINGLKGVNDNLGHMEGDKLIENTASILRQELKYAFKIYRLGGDEFVAIYVDRDLEEVISEIKNAEILCNEIKLDKDVPTGISIGYAKRNEDENFAEMTKRAEVMMYENKKQYYCNRGIDRRVI